MFRLLEQGTFRRVVRFYFPHPETGEKAEYTFSATFKTVPRDRILENFRREIDPDMPMEEKLEKSRAFLDEILIDFDLPVGPAENPISDIATKKRIAINDVVIANALMEAYRTGMDGSPPDHVVKNSKRPR